MDILLWLMIVNVLLTRGWCVKPPGLVKLDQVLLNRVVSSLSVRYDVVSNLRTSLQDKPKTYSAQITLTNKGVDVIAKGDWSLYFCHIRMIEEEYTAHAPQGYLLPGGRGMKVSHINGCLFKLSPTEDFKNLNPGDSIQIPFNASFWCVSKTDVMPNWYIAADRLQARTVTSTAGEGLGFVGAFDVKEKWKRYPSDRYNPYTARQRYEMCDVEDMGKPAYVVVPSPLNISTYDDTKTVDVRTGDWIVVAPKQLTNEANYLAGELGINEITTGASNRIFRLIQLKISDVKIGGNISTNREAYELDVDSSKAIITISGSHPSGVFWGVQSLLSITREGRVPSIYLTDAPRYEFRGMHIDVARNFFEKKEIFKLINVMAMYKLNKLHLHLTDDEGWRLDIPGLPELTKVGGKRCHDPKEESCIASQLGSGPFTGNTGSGFYTAREYQDILRYANEKHVEVIPEFDMPGHAHAAIKAMDARFKNLSHIGKNVESKKYLLSEPNDQSQYLSMQLFKDNAINPCIESTYTFIEALVKAVKELHENAQPLKTFHFGGDEVPLGAWTGSPSCQNLAVQLNTNLTAPSAITHLKRYFVHRVSNITSKYGLDLAAWENGLLGADEIPFQRSYVMNKDVYANTWDNVWEWGKATRPYTLANEGYKVVMTQATHLFFDHPYEPDPEERGYYWAPRFIDTRKTFGFMPDDLYANADFRQNGEKITDVCKEMYENKCEKLRKPENIVGVSGTLWSETIRTPDQLDSMIYPRLLALAERAWHKSAWESEANEARREEMKNKDWVRFVNTLGYKELSRLDKLNVVYRVPPPGAKIESNKLYTKALVPGLTVQYTKDDGKTWHDVIDGIEVPLGIKIATRSADRRRTSRLIEVNEDNKRTKGSSTKIQTMQEVVLLLLFLQKLITL